MQVPTVPPMHNADNPGVRHYHHERGAPSHWKPASHADCWAARHPMPWLVASALLFPTSPTLLGGAAQGVGSGSAVSAGKAVTPPAWPCMQMVPAGVSLGR